MSGIREAQITTLAQQAAAVCGVELVRAEVGGVGRDLTVRVFIDRPEGITHEDCANVSHQLGTLLDVEDPIADRYTLEVSSPGLERDLYTLADYARFADSLAKLKTREAIDNQRNFRGRILSVAGTDIVFDDRTNGQVAIPFDIITKGTLEIDIDEEFKRGKREKRVAVEVADETDDVSGSTDEVVG